MPLSMERRDRMTRAGPRALLRARLLNIVGAGPEIVAERGRDPDAWSIRDIRDSVLLLNPGRGDVDVEDFVSTIRQRYPKLRIFLIESTRRPRELPCEFGNGANQDAGDSPIARAASTSWRAEVITDEHNYVAQGELDFTLVGDEVC